MASTTSPNCNRRSFMAAAGYFAGGPLIIGATREEAARGPIPASVLVEPEPLHELPKTQYGHFIEHLGKCIKGGIWAEGEAPQMFLGGVRKELMTAIRSIHPSLIRYPGGCFADGYHWQDGIGPRSGRPLRPNLAWGKFGPEVGPDEDNHFGTDEFLEFCAAVGAAPMLTANVGSGTAEEAAAWVEYCNGPADSKWGRERAQNGHPAPYAVKYWFVGNEIFYHGEIGRLTPPQYVQSFRAYAQAMRQADPDVKLIAVGDFKLSFEGKRNNRIVLEGAGEFADYLSIHRYAPARRQIDKWAFRAGLQSSRMTSVYYDVLASVRVVESALKDSIADVHAYSPPGKTIPIALDEWNLWFNGDRDLGQTNYNLRDGLWVASVFHLFHCHAPDVPLANIAQLVNCLGIIISDERGTFLTPSALAFQLYTEKAGDRFLASTTQAPALPHDSGLPALDVSATRQDRRLALFLINRHYHAPLAVKVSLAGMGVKPAATMTELYHPNPVQYNSFEKPEAVKLIESAARLELGKDQGAGGFSISLKPHSLTCVELEVEGA